jgi:hypothetical protein
VKNHFTPILFAAAAAGLFSGCETTNTGHPAGTVPYAVSIETSDPGSRIEVDGDYVGVSPLTVTVWGDKDGTFHGAGDGHTVFVAYPVRAGQFVQRKVFLNGGQQFMFGQDDRIPSRIYFDLNQKPEGLQVILPK